MEPIHIYVRKGRGDDERVITFLLPQDVAHTEWLQRGYAIDGNQAMITVKGDSNGGPALSDALCTTQRDLVVFLAESGYPVHFM